MVSEQLHKLIPTSREVWAVIRARHSEELKVFSTASYPMGFMGGKTAFMETSYGFDGASCPIISARTEWDIDPTDETKRLNERHQFWLCAPQYEAAS